MDRLIAGGSFAGVAPVLISIRDALQ